jgi:hypothetical protein
MSVCMCVCVFDLCFQAKNRPFLSPVGEGRAEKDHHGKRN